MEHGLTADEILRRLLEQDDSLGLVYDYEYTQTSCLYCVKIVDDGRFIFGDVADSQFPHAEGCLIAAAWKWLERERGAQDEN